MNFALKRAEQISVVNNVEMTISNNALIPTAPTGNPPIRLSKTVTPASPGRYRIFSVKGDNTLPILPEIPYSTEKFARNINGNSEGINTPKAYIKPFFAPSTDTFGIATTPMHTDKKSNVTVMNNNKSVFLL